MENNIVYDDKRIEIFQLDKESMSGLLRPKLDTILDIDPQSQSFEEIFAPQTYTYNATYEHVRDVLMEDEESKNLFYRLYEDTFFQYLNAAIVKNGEQMMNIPNDTIFSSYILGAKLVGDEDDEQIRANNYPKAISSAIFWTMFPNRDKYRKYRVSQKDLGWAFSNAFDSFSKDNWNNYDICKVPSEYQPGNKLYYMYTAASDLVFNRNPTSIVEHMKREHERNAELEKEKTPENNNAYVFIRDVNGNPLVAITLN